MIDNLRFEPPITVDQGIEIIKARRRAEQTLYYSGCHTEEYREAIRDSRIYEEAFVKHPITMALAMHTYCHLLTGTGS